MKSEIKRAVGYRRVSMPDQVNGHSLDAQEVNIRRYAEEHGWELIEIYVDAGISAKKGSRRPAFEQMLNDAREGKFDIIIVDKIDRFYRHLGGLLTTLDQLNSYGVSFASVQEKLDFTTPWGKLMLTVLGMLAEIYIDNLRQETRKGKIQRARKGLWLGAIPYGYCNGLCSRCTDPNGAGYCPDFGGKDKSDGKVMVAHPIESQVVRWVFEQYAGGKMSHKMIAEALNQMHITLDNGESVPVRQKGAPGRSQPGPFSKDIIRDMLKRACYLGKIPYQGVADDGRHRKRCAPLEYFPGVHPAIVSEELFQKVQEMVTLRYHNPLTRGARPARLYPLTGILYCGFCGGHMRGVSNGSSQAYYKDGNQLDSVCGCPQTPVKATEIEQNVVQWLKEVVLNASNSMDAPNLQARLSAIQQRFERAKELYLAGELDRQAYKEEKQRLKNEQENLHFQESRAKIALIELLQPQLEAWDALSQIERKRLLRLALEAAYVQGNALVAVQPSVAFLPVLPADWENQRMCNSGEGGIRTRGREFSSRQPLSRRPHSTSLAPPQVRS